MKTLIEQGIKDFVERFRTAERFQTSWREPLVAFAGAKDPLFPVLKDVVSPSHCMPEDLLEDARTVIVYFLPFEKSVPKGNRHGSHASREWALAYVETNRLINALNDRLADLLERKGYRATKLPPTHNFDKKKLTSDWSHKHVAFIAGLGKFGVHHLLITDKGCCGRLGSLITTADIEPTTRPTHEYCLHKINGKCLICVDKCPVGALKDGSFDRQSCYDVLLDNARIHEDLGLSDVCGKCTCVVPCSFQNPVEKTLSILRIFGEECGERGAPEEDAEKNAKK